MIFSERLIEQHISSGGDTQNHGRAAGGVGTYKGHTHKMKLRPPAPLDDRPAAAAQPVT